jgi:hypothetical protein
VRQLKQWASPAPEFSNASSAQSKCENTPFTSQIRKKEKKTVLWFSEDEIQTANIPPPSDKNHNEFCGELTAGKFLTQDGRTDTCNSLIWL